ncbi:MAG: metallophosphoesterase [Corallococcus sp.]|nr:metallophosphoesterase [Bacillota bacterium]MCM1533218.1 metallophosphoesterase [Corallococcus sp.]
MLIEKIKKHWLAIVAVAYSLLVALFWLALRVNWSGISKTFGADKNRSFFIMETPLLICIFLWLAAIFAIVAMFLWSGKKKWPFITSLAVSGVFTIGIIVVVALGAIDYMPFILPTFGVSVLITLCLVAFALLLFFPITGKSKLCTALKCVTLSVAVLGTVLVAFDVKANYFTYDAVVYAVEDDYQIVFSTNDHSIAWVEIDGEKYYDLYAGSMKSKDLVHKITVPQKELDEAKHYKICAQTMIYRGPFGGYKGAKVLSKEYDFRPVNLDDGLVYYTMTDVHGARKGAVNAASSVKDMDFLIILGDSYSMIDSEYDAQFTNLLANDVTKGEFPVIYARGNHEIKGEYAEDLYKYVGSKNGNYYYDFELAGGKVYGITLDLGEDHTEGANDDDGWWEYYGTDVYSQYRNDQTEFLRDIAENKKDKYLNSEYTVVCCHIPIQFVNSRKNNIGIKAEWTEILNEIKPDLCVYGHQHDLYPFLDGQETKYDGKANKYNEEGKLVYNTQFKTNKDGTVATYSGFLTDYEFNGFICGRRGSSQQDDVGALNKSEHIGLETRVNFTTGKQTHVYINSRGEHVAVCNPFVEGAAQTEFETLLKTFD